MIFIGSSSTHFLSGSQCIAKYTAGKACIDDSQCVSESCKGGRCCNISGASSFCTACDAAADCISCSDGHYLSGNQCIAKHTDSSFCIDDSQCASDICKGGRCCNMSSQTLGCITCDLSGHCSSCSDKYFLSGNECFTKYVDGNVCDSTGGHVVCLSNTCVGRRCCNVKGQSSGCVACDMKGDCGSCNSSYILSGGACMANYGDGDTCGNDDECASEVCRGGRCCNINGQSPGCIACDAAGDCIGCSRGYTVNSSTCTALSSNNYADQVGSNPRLGTVIAVAIALGIAVSCLLVLAFAWRKRNRATAIVGLKSGPAPSHAAGFATNPAFCAEAIYEDINTLPDAVTGAKTVEFISENSALPPVGEQQLYDVIEQTNNLALSGLGSRQSHQQSLHLRARTSSSEEPATAPACADKQRDTPSECSICENESF